MTREERDAMKAGDYVWRVTPLAMKPSRHRLLHNRAGTWLWATTGGHVCNGERTWFATERAAWSQLADYLSARARAHDRIASGQLHRRNQLNSKAMAAKTRGDRSKP